MAIQSFSNCSCHTPVSEYNFDRDDLDSILTRFEAVRTNCSALHEILIPDSYWSNFQKAALASCDEACHQHILLLAFTRGFLRKITSPIHRYMIEIDKAKIRLNKNYITDLRESWMQQCSALKRHQRARTYLGKLTELQVAEWLQEQGWKISNLEAWGGNCDVEGVSPRNVECMFEVKAIGPEDNDFLRVVDSLQGRNSADIISPYTASNYILFRAYEASKKLCMSTKVPIACLVVAEETWYRFDIPLQKNWMRWESPRFFEEDVGWQKAIQRNKWSYPGSDALQRLFSGLNIWIVKRNADFQYSLHQTVPLEACGEKL